LRLIEALEWCRRFPPVVSGNYRFVELSFEQSDKLYTGSASLFCSFGLKNSIFATII
jgi:hypothetical protein